MSTLETAAALISGDRRWVYGDAEENFAVLAVLWSAILRDYLREEIPARMVPVLLAALKIARLSHDPDHADSWVDLAGYAGLGGDMR